MQKAGEWEIPDWIWEALEAMKPPGAMTVSQWADTYRVMDGKISPMPGRWRTDATPYLRNIMDDFSDPEVEEIILVKPTQVGGTEAILNMMGWAVMQDPSSAMVVYPTEALGKFASINRIQTMVEASPELAKRYDSNSPDLELQFSGMFLAIAGANSPAGLASRPCRYLFMDEVDKYPPAAGKEADPRFLARERTKAYDTSRKIVEVSTPTFESGPIWQDYQAVDTQYNYFVVCPHCGAEWSFKLKQLRFDKSQPVEVIRSAAVYICEECGGVISESQRVEMIRQGWWKAVRKGSRRRVGYHMNVFISPWVRLGDIAESWILSQRSPDTLMNFINSWLAEPFKQVESQLDSEKLLRRQSRYGKKEVPPEALLLTGGVDVQKNCFYLSVRAWLPDMTSYNIYHAKVYTWQEVEYAMNVPYLDREGRERMVNLACIDSGYNTDEVYDFCLKNQEWAVASKGSSSHRMDARYKLSTINKDGASKGMPLCVVDTNHYKDAFFARCRRPEEESGGFYLYKDCDPEYAEMLTAEHKVVKRVNGRLLSVWEPKHDGVDNHYLDCEVYAACAADLCGLRTISAEFSRGEHPPVQDQHRGQEREPPVSAPAAGGYFSKNSMGGGYFARR